jgi:hypothetical protein
MSATTWRKGKSPVKVSSWEEFQDYMAECLQMLRENDDRFIVLRAKSRHRYVQFCSVHGGGIIGEAVSNYYLRYEGAEKLTPATRRLLANLGWNKPAPPGHNYRRDWRRNTSPRKIAMLAVKTLRDAFEVCLPSDLEVRRDQFASRSSGPLAGMPSGSAREFLILGSEVVAPDQVVVHALISKNHQPRRPRSAQSRQAAPAPRAPGESCHAMEWFFISFADNARFLGGCVVRARGPRDAINRTSKLGIYPGGEAMCQALPEDQMHRVPTDLRNRLLTEWEVMEKLQGEPV